MSTTAELKEACLETVGEIVSPSDPQTFYDDAKALVAINAAQRLFCLLTLTLEASATITLAEDQTWYTSAPSDLLVPLRFKDAATGRKILPATLAELDALNPSWQRETFIPDDYPERYVLLGFGLMGFYRKPVLGGGTRNLTLTYAQCPATLAADNDIPSIPEECHASLIDGAVPLMRLLEGAQELQKVTPMFNDFIAAANKQAALVRARYRQKAYDQLPFELANFDLKRLLMKAAKPKPQEAKG